MSDEREIDIINAGMDDAGFDDIIRMVEAMRAVTEHFIEAEPDASMAMSKLMTAAAIFSGTILGALIVTGAMRDQDKRRATQVMTRNFRNGIDVGKQRATRIFAQDVAGHA